MLTGRVILRAYKRREHDVDSLCVHGRGTGGSRAEKRGDCNGNNVSVSEVNTSSLASG
jgi:hypothetical protein